VKKLIASLILAGVMISGVIGCSETKTTKSSTPSNDKAAETAAK
jgi:hypothetical protein